MGSNNPVFTFLSVSPSPDSRSQINLECLPLHKSQALLLLHPHRNTVNPEQLTSSSRAGTRWDRDLPRAQLSAWICNELRCDLSMRSQYGESPRLLPRLSPQPLSPANSLTISLKVKSSCMPTVSAPYGDLRYGFVSVDDLLHLWRFDWLF